MIEAVIFDMDGVILDNSREHLESFKRLGKEEGREFTEEDVLSVFGQRNDEMLEALLGRQLKSAEVKRIAFRKEELYRQIVGPRLRERMVPGLVDLVEGLHSAGMSMALATSGPIENVDLVLDGLQIRRFFDSVITGADVREGKPDPEVFLLSAERLGVSPVSCVVFEDTPSGVEAALRAGSRCIALATTHSQDELGQLNPDQVIQDFTQISVSEIQALS